MAISQFKAHALKVVDQVAKNHESIIITERGIPLAKISPYQDKSPFTEPGQLADTLVFEEDIVSPLGEDMWKASG